MLERDWAAVTVADIDHGNRHVVRGCMPSLATAVLTGGVGGGGISEEARPFAYSLFPRLPLRGWGVFRNSISFERQSLDFRDMGLAWEGCWGPRSWNSAYMGGDYKFPVA